MTDFDILRVYE